VVSPSSDHTPSNSRASNGASSTGSVSDSGAPDDNLLGTSSYARDVSPLDLLVALVRGARVIAWVTGAVVVLGMIYALVAAPTYRVSARLALESPSDQQPMSGGLAALRGLGIGIGPSAGSGLAPEAFATLFTSREVLLATARDTFYFQEEGAQMTYVAYVNRPPSTLGRIAEIAKNYTVGALREALVGSGPARTQVEEGESVVFPTEDEENAIKALREAASSAIDLETGLLRVTVQASEPLLSTHVLDSVVRHTEQRVRAIRTAKTRQNLDFAQARFTEAEQEMRAAEERLADFLDRNRNPESAMLSVERDRLERTCALSASSTARCRRRWPRPSSSCSGVSR
jgi:uncharacterized protein involved in exopolysaccharide biosynthesis